MARYVDIEPYEGCKIVANNEDKGILVKDILSADVQEVKHGEWIDKPLDKFKKCESTCSECGWNGECNNLASQGRCKAWQGISCKNNALKELGVTEE